MPRILLALCALVLSATGAAAVTVDLDARRDVDQPGTKHDSPVFVMLSAGTYQVTPVAGTFTAWNAWSTRGDTTNCVGDACTKGWLNDWSVFTPDSADLPFQTLSQGTGVAGRRAWRTAELALANARGLQFTLLGDQRVGFAISDTPIRDNSGGMSLSVAAMPAIPLPAAGLLLLSGLGGLILFARRRA
jgi:hypothetical protein